MTNCTFKNDLSELYQGEIVGEILFDAMLAQFPDTDCYYKTATLLQMETEAKAWLRPAALALGVDLAEQAETRATGTAFAASLAGLTWREAMVTLRDGVASYVQRYTEIAATAPPEYRALAEAMVTHERALHAFFVEEAEGRPQAGLASIIAQLKFPLPPPSAAAA